MQQHTREDSRHFRDAWQILSPAEQRVVALRCRDLGNPQTTDHPFATQAVVMRCVTWILARRQRAAVAADQPERSGVDGVRWRPGYEMTLSDITQHLGERKGVA